MSTLQVSNIHFESSGNNRLQYTGANAFNLVGGGVTVATVNTTAISFPLGFTINNLTANNIYSGSGGTLLVANSTVVNATHLAGVAGASYQLNSTLTANVAIRTANNANNLGGVAAASYQLNSTLAANVAILTANNANNLGGVIASSYYRAGSTDVALADGGTNSSLTAAAGAIAFSNATSVALTAAGTSGQVLTSAGTGTPTWTSQASLSVGSASSATTATSATSATTATNQSGGTVAATTGSFSGRATFNGGVASGFYIAKQNTIGEGGEFTIEKSDTSTLSGNLTVDLVGNTFRIFEAGGSFRGVTIDIGAQGAQSPILTSANYNSYSPTLTGTGASGTWGISISGTAANATNLAGVAASNYLLKSGGTLTGALTGTTITSTGFYLTTTGGSEKHFMWQMSDRNVYFYGQDTGNKLVGLYDSNTAINRWYSNTAGALVVQNDITAFASDERLKTNIRTIENALDKVKSIRGVNYEFNTLGKELGKFRDGQHVGVIAQDIEKVLPEVIELAPFDRDLKDETKSRSGENYKTVKYDKIVALLIEAIKELSTKVDSLTKELEELKN